MKAIVHTYSEVIKLTVTIRGDRTIRREDPWIYHKKPVINKMACYYPFGTDTCSQLYEMTSDRSIMPGAKLFVAPECRTGRDTFRNSGYKITRDRDNANVIVVPDIIPETFYKLDCHIVATDTENDEMYLVTIHKSGYKNSEIDMEDIDLVSSYLETVMVLVPDETKTNKTSVWFLPKCDDLAGVLQENMMNVPYIQESLVPINTSTTISPETLVFWENMDDPNLLMRTVCTSDWMRYRVTMLAFLCNTQSKIANNNWYNFANGDFKRVLQMIGYHSYSDFRYQVQGKTITPEDYNMLQAYLYMKMGLGPEGGVIEPKRLTMIHPDYLPYLQRKIALKPLTIPVDMDVKTLSTMATG